MICFRCSKQDVAEMETGKYWCSWCNDWAITEKPPEEVKDERQSLSEKKAETDNYWEIGGGRYATSTVRKQWLKDSLSSFYILAGFLLIIGIIAGVIANWYPRIAIGFMVVLGLGFLWTYRPTYKLRLSETKSFFINALYALLYAVTLATLIYLMGWYWRPERWLNDSLMAVASILIGAALTAPFAGALFLSQSLLPLSTDCPRCGIRMERVRDSVETAYSSREYGGGSYVRSGSMSLVVERRCPNCGATAHDTVARY